MANKTIKICGAIHSIYPMKSNEFNGNTYYSQMFKLAYKDGEMDKLMNFELKGKNINKFADAITSSYNNQSAITLCLDLSVSEKSKFASVSCWKIDMGDTTEQDVQKKAVDSDTPIVGIAPSEPLDDNVEYFDAVEVCEPF